MEELVEISRIGSDEVNDTTFTKICISVADENFTLYHFHTDDHELHARFVKIGQDLLHKAVTEMLDSLKDELQEDEEESENEDLTLPF